MPEDDIFVFAFDAGMPAEFEIAAETTGGDFPLLEDRLEQLLADPAVVFFPVLLPEELVPVVELLAPFECFDPEVVDPDELVCMFPGTLLQSLKIKLSLKLCLLSTIHFFRHDMSKAF